MLDKFKKKLEIEKSVYLRVKVRPGAAQDKVKEVLLDDTVKIDIKLPPVKGRANKELINFLAKEFLVPRENVKILSGVSDKIKLVKIEI